MKNKIYALAVAVFVFIGIASCDNGNTSPGIIDSDPTIEIGSMTGLIEGETFSVDVTFTDGAEGSSISTLAEAVWAITSNGAQVAGETVSLTGDSQTITISVPGLAVGDYNLTVVVTDTNDNSADDSSMFSVASARPDFDISGDWRMEAVEGSLRVGPTQGSGDWWSISAADVQTRACFYDDVYTFGADGSTYSYDMGADTWLETWQGVANDGCGAPVAPFDGAGSYTYEYTSTSIKLVGQGAHLGLSKVNNEGEISQGAAVADEITYTIVEQSQDGDTRRMTLEIEAADGVWWTYQLISGEAAPANPVVGTWKIEPIEASLAVGPAAGSADWWFIPAADVQTRACLYDDTYTFMENGSFTMDMGADSWIETWQGVGADGCAAPVAPHDGSGTFTYTYDGSSLVINGEGGHVGLAKVVNGNELPNVAVPSSVTYTVAEFTEDAGVKRMTLHIEIANGGWWTFKLISE